MISSSSIHDVPGIATIKPTKNNFPFPFRKPSDFHRSSFHDPHDSESPVSECKPADRFPDLGSTDCFQDHLLNGSLSFKIYNHTDLMRGLSADGRDFPSEFEPMKDQADVVIIDEAHHFRNRGLANAEDGTIRSRYWKLYDIAEGKTVFLLTATPVNNALTDFQHEIELFSRVEGNTTAFAGVLGIHNLASHFQQLGKALKRTIAGLEHGELFGINQADAEKVLFDDKLFRALVVQRSRAYAQQSQLQQGGSQAIFPTREAPKVGAYSVKKTYGHLLAKVEAAFSKPEQLFSLAVYYPLAKWKAEQKKIAGEPPGE